jgi:hypothetical protein
MGKLKLTSIFPALLEVGSLDNQSEVVGLHSGNLGDIIYSLPTAFALGITHYVVNICADPAFGNRSINTDSALAIAKFLCGQGSIKKATVIRTQVPWEYADPNSIGVDYVLDTFRINWVEEKLHLVHRHALPFGIKVDAAKPWLTTLPPKPNQKPYVVVALTQRYRRFDGQYYEQLLKDLPEEQIYFVGVDGDLPQKLHVPGLFKKFDDLAEMAAFVTGASLVIGNPSFPYAIAEATKTQRWLETPDNLNVHPLESSGLAMHLYSIEELRRRLFALFGLEDKSVPYLLSRISQLEQELETAKQQASLDAQTKADLLKEIEKYKCEVEKHLHSHKAEAESAKQLTKLLQDLTQRHTTLTQLEESHRRILESPLKLLKQFLRETVLASEVGRRIHRQLSRSTALRNLWRGRVSS